MTRCVEDFLAHLTRALFLNARASIQMASCVAELVAKELGFDKIWKEQQLREYKECAQGYFLK